MELRENDFKYVIQDFSHVYIGARLTFEELGEQYDTPSRLKETIYRSIMGEVELTDRICEHMLELDKKSRTYLMYSQLKAQIKVCFFKKQLDKNGVEQEAYESKNYTIDELMADSFLKEHKEAYVIQEFSFSKRKLMSLAV